MRYYGIELNYQLFASGGGADKTEKATPKKKNDARCLLLLYYSL
jgi:flagellar biosynthetic protein FlhB